MAKLVDERIRSSRELLLNPYAYLDGDGNFDAAYPSDRDVYSAGRQIHNPDTCLDNLEAVEGPPEDPQRRSIRTPIDPVLLLRGRQRGQRFSRDDIEEIARNVHLELWRNRAILFPDTAPTPLDTVDPAVALGAIGFSVDADAALGEYPGNGGMFEVAGLLDRTNQRVEVSGHLGAQTRLFTMAHELGHAVLHAGSGLHRDRALDGAASHQPDPTETEANRFAAAFLMPKKLVRRAFREAFGMETFILDEASAFGLKGMSLASMQERFPTRREVARVLARAGQYHGHAFEPLAAQFRVAVETMAIRLEDLDLV